MSAPSITEALRGGKGLRLMTHIVAGYPDAGTSGRLLSALAEAGSDFIEVQVPFSDPMADGSTIMAANQAALDRGATVKTAFDLVEQASKALPIPLLFMTYLNVPWRMGLERFVQKAKACGAGGVILPDLPFDEDLPEYVKACHTHGVDPIFVVSPGTPRERLAAIAALGRGFLYATLKVGITGTGSGEADRGLRFLEELRGLVPLPIAAGFGITSPEHVKRVKGLCDIAVVGSALIREYERGGIDAVGALTARLKGACA